MTEESDISSNMSSSVSYDTSDSTDTSDTRAFLQRVAGPCRSYFFALAQSHAQSNEMPSWKELIQALTDLELTDEEATELGPEIMKHQNLLQTQVERSVDLRVALLDFFTNVYPRLSCPKIVDMERYVQTVRYGNADPLTGLANRRHMEEQLDREINRSRRYDLTFSVLYADLDDFKQVNDNYGHATGDEVLRTFATHLREHLRAEDVAARFGGEEFVILMPQTDMTGAVTLADRLRTALKPVRVDGAVRISFSAGVASFPGHGDNVATLLRHADRGLYRAKVTGKNRVIVEPPEKRRHERVPASHTVTYYDAQRSAGLGTTRDISLSGVRITADRKPAAGQHISISVNTRDTSERFLVGAEVVWVRTLQRDRQVEFGVRYADPNRDKAEQIFSLVTATQG